MSRFAVAPMALVIALGLSGCAPEPEPVAVPTVEPTPEITVEPALRPNPAIALDCAELFSLDEVQSQIAAPIEVKRDETSVPSEFWHIPALADGALSCRWGGESRTGALYDDGLEVDVRVGGDAAFDALVASAPELPISVTGADLAVATDCGFGRQPDAAGAPGFCAIVARAGDRVVYLRYSDSEQVFASEADITAVAIRLMEATLERVSGSAGVDQAWQPPGDPLVADEAFCDSAGADLLAAAGVDSPFSAVSDPLFGDPRLRACQFFFGATDASSVSIWVVEGASWAAGIEQTERPALGQPYESRVTAAGAQWWLSPSGEAVQGRAALGGSLVDVVVFWGDIGITVEQAQSAITDFMEQYAESPPGT